MVRTRMEPTNSGSSAATVASPCPVPQITQFSEDEVLGNGSNWYTCVVCQKNVAKDCDVKKFPCLHLVCGSPYNCLQKILISKQNPFTKNTQKSYCTFGTCPLCIIIYSELDVEEGDDEKKVMLSLSRNQCSCKRLSKFQCSQCDTIFCDICAKYHDSIVHFKERHTLQNLGKELVFKCSICSIYKGDYVEEKDDKVLKHFCQACLERSGKSLISWTDYVDRLNTTYLSYIHTLSQMEEGANKLITILKGIVSKKKNLRRRQAVLNESITEGLQNLEFDLVNRFKLRIRHLNAFFKAVINPIGAGIVKFKNFSKYITVADRLISSISTDLNKLLERYCQDRFENIVVEVKTPIYNNELTNSCLPPDELIVEDVGSAETVETEKYTVLAQPNQTVTPQVMVRFETVPIKLETETDIETKYEIPDWDAGEETENTITPPDTNKIPPESNETLNYSYVQGLNEILHHQVLNPISDVQGLNEILHHPDLNPISDVQGLNEILHHPDLNPISDVQGLNEILHYPDLNAISGGQGLDELSHYLNLNGITNAKESSKIYRSANLNVSNALNSIEVPNASVLNVSDLSEISNDPEGNEICSSADLNVSNGLNSIEVSNAPAINVSDLSDPESNVSITADLNVSHNPDLTNASDSCNFPKVSDLNEISNSSNLSGISNATNENFHASDLSEISSIPDFNVNSTSSAPDLGEDLHAPSTSVNVEIVVNPKSKQIVKRRCPSSSKGGRKTKRKKLITNELELCDCLGRLCKICSKKDSPSGILHNISPVVLELRHYDMLNLEVQVSDSETKTYLECQIDAQMDYEEETNTITEGTCAICFDGGGPMVICDNNKCQKVFGDKCHIPSFKKIPDETIKWDCFHCINKSKFGTYAFQNHAREIYFFPDNCFQGDIQKFLTACKFIYELYSIHESLVVRFKFVQLYRENYKTDPAFNLNAIRDRLSNPTDDNPPYSSYQELIDDLHIMIKQASILYSKKSKEGIHLSIFQKFFNKKMKDYFQ